MMNDEELYLFGMRIGLKPKQVNETVFLFHKISMDPSWNNTRNDRTLLVDCFYIIAKREKTGITIKKMVNVTTDMFGYGTKPNPNKWRHTHGHLLV